jgi:hypothetical protein
MKLRPFFRWFALVFSILFAIFAALQINDLDYIALWIIAYMVPSVLLFLGFTGRVWRMPSLALAVIYFAAGILLFPEEFQGVSLANGYSVQIEEARESLGLGICAIILLVVFGAGVKRPERNSA